MSVVSWNRCIVALFDGISTTLYKSGGGVVFWIWNFIFVVTCKGS
jgi:hypothetical protein